MALKGQVVPSSAHVKDRKKTMWILLGEKVNRKPLADTSGSHLPLGLHFLLDFAFISDAQCRTGGHRVRVTSPAPCDSLASKFPPRQSLLKGDFGTEFEPQLDSY